VAGSLERLSATAHLTSGDQLYIRTKARKPKRWRRYSVRFALAQPKDVTFSSNINLEQKVSGIILNVWHLNPDNA
jgi:hypothetical protein